MSRRVFLLGIGIAVVALAFAVTDWVIAAIPGVTEANARRIRPGMTLAEVESILGAKARGRGMADGPPVYLFQEWSGPEGRLFVCFEQRDIQDPGAVARLGRQGASDLARFSLLYDYQGPICNAVFFKRTASPTTLERLRSWLGW